MTVCGMISHYNETARPPGNPDQLPRIMRAILTRRLKIQGIIVFDYAHREPDFFGPMSEMDTKRGTSLPRRYCRWPR
ncbi:MAG: hypothetical protein CM1200mP41_39040 [Gammaproteobacteria bacterium]|nr:MAG: hypothetical protein CM1200mP41_39040 [Gammaproteobacteria bacterium]